MTAPNEDSGPSILEVAYRVVLAVTATMGAVRSARSALASWQAVVNMVRGEKEEDAEGEADSAA